MLAILDVFTLPREVVADQVDVLPPKRRKVLKEVDDDIMAAPL